MTDLLPNNFSCSIAGTGKKICEEDCILGALFIEYKIFGKVSVQPHTIVKQICFPNGNVLFLSLFSLFKN